MTILKRLGVNMDSFFDPIVWKFQALVIGGWNGLHSVDPLLDEEVI